MLNKEVRGKTWNIAKRWKIGFVLLLDVHIFTLWFC